MHGGGGGGGSREKKVYISALQAARAELTCCSRTDNSTFFHNTVSKCVDVEMWKVQLLKFHLVRPSTVIVLPHVSSRTAVLPEDSEECLL